MHTFSPLRPDFPNLKLFPHEYCQNEANQSIRIENGIFDARCLPDTLYSWDSLSHVQDFEKNLGVRDKAWAPFIPTLFMTRSPLASHGYGEFPIRIKLRKGVRWKETLWGCDQFANPDESQKAIAREEFKNTVYFRSNSNFFDFAICSSDVIDSWSYALPETYDEVMREFFFTEKESSENEKYFDRYVVDTQVGTPFVETPIDHLDFSFAKFQKSLKILLPMTLQQRGKLFCNPDGSQSKKRKCIEADHFRTEHPIYYNED